MAASGTFQTRKRAASPDHYLFPCQSGNNLPRLCELFNKLIAMHKPAPETDGLKEKSDE
jgi:hypothetical protein